MKINRRAAVGALAAAGAMQVNSSSAQSSPGSADGATRPGGALSVREFGATGDGRTDDSGAINAALASGRSDIVIPDGQYRVANSILIDGSVRLSGSPGAVLLVDSGVDEAVVVGSRRLFVGVIEKLIVRGQSQDFRGGSVGFALHNMAEATFYDCEARYFETGFLARPGAQQRVAYSTWINAQGIACRRNFALRETTDGFSNENVFIGGRAFAGSKTETNVYWPGGNHNRFIAMSCEGNARQAMLIGGHSNAIFHCRTEGEWEVDDIVVTGEAIYTYVSVVSLYTTVRNNGVNSRIETGLGGSFREIGLGGVAVEHLRRMGSSTGGSPLLELEDLGTSGDGAGIRSRLSRSTTGSYHLRCHGRDGDELVAGIDARGNIFAAKQVEIGNADRNGGGLIMGRNHEWYDSNGVKRQTLLDEPTDGQMAAFGMKVDVPRSSSGIGKPGQWAADARFIYAYVGDGTRHRWIRSAASEW